MKRKTKAAAKAAALKVRVAIEPLTPPDPMGSRTHGREVSPPVVVEVVAPAGVAVKVAKAKTKAKKATKR
jgi:hypothetical protein